MKGSGFDLIWASGKIWSFLADDDKIRSEWVLQLNRSLSIARDKSKKQITARVEGELKESNKPANITDKTHLRSPAFSETVNNNNPDRTFNQYLIGDKSTPINKLNPANRLEDPDPFGNNVYNIR